MGISTKRMRVLTVVGKDNPQRYLINIENDKVIQKLLKLIFDRQHDNAIILAMSSGRYIGALSQKQAMFAEIDLILTQTNAHWSLLD